MQERRLAAIMFTDIVGYTALMGKNEDRAIQILKINREIHKLLLKRYNGSLIKEMGDGILASFSSNSDAVRCAIEIQQEVKAENIQLRIGIHEGEMVFAGADVLGDGVNVASRLEELAEEGCIYISGAVYKDIKNKTGISVEFLEEKILKNVDEPVKIYRVYYGDSSVESKPVGDKKRRRGFKFNYYILAGLVVVLIAILLIGKFIFYNEKSELEKSIAVLPFENMSVGEAYSHLGDAITDEIILELQKIKEFDRVLSRTSTMQYKENRPTIPEIAEKLGVNYLIEGSIQRHNEDVSIRVQVIRARHEDHIWGDEYDGKWEDIFSIQDEIALKVAEELKTVLTPEEIRKIEKNPTENLEAYNLYLKGRYFWNKRTAEGFHAGIEYFHKAIEKDPAYPLAYVGIADCYNLLGWHDLLPPEEVHPKAKAAAEKALMMDETLSQAHASLAYVKMLYDWDWQATDKEFKRALELNPNYAEAHQWYSEYLAYMGRHDESILEAKRAQELDPLSLSINHNLGLIFYEARQFDLAIEKYQETLQTDPSFIVTYNYLGLAYAGRKMYYDAITNVQTAIDLTEKQSPLYIGTLGFIYASMGNGDEAKEILEYLLELCQHRYIAPVSLAIIYGTLGQKDQAFEWMEKGYEVRDDFMMTLKVEPRLDGLRSDPRYKDLLERMNLLN